MSGLQVLLVVVPDGPASTVEMFAKPLCARNVSSSTQLQSPPVPAPVPACGVEDIRRNPTATPASPRMARAPGPWYS